MFNLENYHVKSAAITGAVVAVGSAGYSIYNSEKKKNDAKKAIEEFQQQELSNPFENLAISTLKSDQQTEANLSNAASSIDALQRGGTRSVLAGVPRLSESNILLQNLVSQDIQKQEQERDLLIAKGESNIQNIREQRELGALSGLGQQLQVARQETADGIVNAVQGGLALGSAISSTPPKDDTKFQFQEPQIKNTINVPDPSNNPLLKGSIFDNSNASFTDFNFD